MDDGSNRGGKEDEKEGLGRRRSDELGVRILEISASV